VLDEHWLYPYSRAQGILGFSSDSEWMIVRSIRQLGMKYTESRLRFIHIGRWEQVVVPLYLESDFDNGGVVPRDADRRRAAIGSFLEQLLVMKANHVSIPLPDRITLDTSGRTAPRIRMSFQDEIFDVHVAQVWAGQSALILRNARYLPPREAFLALERTEMASHSYFGADDNPRLIPPHEIPIHPKRLLEVAAIAFDHRAKFLALGVSTSINHYKGVSDRHYFAFPVADIRRRCVEALRL
jgi:hypothetical protein